jgi:hypothetical protein
MKKGDKFIYYFTNGVEFGEIDQIFEKIKYDVDHGIKIKVPFIISTQGKTFNAKSCFIIDSEIRPSFIKRVIRYVTK